MNDYGRVDARGEAMAAGKAYVALLVGGHNDATLFYAARAARMLWEGVSEVWAREWLNQEREHGSKVGW